MLYSSVYCHLRKFYNCYTIVNTVTSLYSSIASVCTYPVVVVLPGILPKMKEVLRGTASPTFDFLCMPAACD